MPTYEYLCKACDHEFEREQRISEPPVKTCPRCKAQKVKRLISRTSFHLKGGGWYSDLYSKPGGKGAKKGGDSKADSGTPSEAKPSATESPAKSESGPGKDSGGSGSGSKAAA